MLAYREYAPPLYGFFYGRLSAFGLLEARAA